MEVIQRVKIATKLPPFMVKNLRSKENICYSAD